MTLTVKGSDSSSSLSTASYSLVVISGSGGVFRSNKASYSNLSFTNGGIVNLTST
jgi:hypothetical protein